MFNKIYTFNGVISLELSNGRFTMNPTKDSKLFSIIYDITMDQYKDDRLSLSITRDTSSRSYHIINLMKSDMLVLEIHIEPIDIRSDQLFTSFFKLKQSIRIIGECKLKIHGGLIETVFKYNDRTSHTVFTNVETKVYDVNAWLCAIWPPRGRCLEYCAMIDGRVVAELQSFPAGAAKGPMAVSVAEKCIICPITEDRCPIAVPWDRNSQTMLNYCSNILDLEVDRILLIDKNHDVVDNVGSLDIRDFRAQDSLEMPHLFYDVPSAKMVLSSMRVKVDLDPVNVIVGTNRDIASIKAQLAFKMKVDAGRLIICRGDSLLRDEEVVSVDQELKYCLGLCHSDIRSQDPLGEGSYGHVYKCVSGDFPDPFALKVFKSSLVELRAATVLKEMAVMIYVDQHPIEGESEVGLINIVRYLAFYITDNDVSIAMEYVPGGTLTDYLALNGPLTDECDIRTLSRGILEGVRYLHRRKIVHRDIKGSNVLLVDHFVAKLADFGLSKILADYTTRELSNGITRTVEIGTVRWMAPEIIRGYKYGLKVDIWSVGATVVEMVTAEVPYAEYIDEASVMMLVGNMQEFVFDSPRPLSDQLWQLIKSCLIVDKKRRLKVDNVLGLDFFC